VGSETSGQEGLTDVEALRQTVPRVPTTGAPPHSLPVLPRCLRLGGAPDRRPGSSVRPPTRVVTQSAGTQWSRILRRRSPASRTRPTWSECTFSERASTRVPPRSPDHADECGLSVV
jgi:hypothetical protein